MGVGEYYGGESYCEYYFFFNGYNGVYVIFFEVGVMVWIVVMWFVDK